MGNDMAMATKIKFEFSDEELDFLTECNSIVGEKRQASRDMNSIAKNQAQITGVDKLVLIKCKDYHYYKGRGWLVDEEGNYDPLTKGRGSKFPDRVTGPFMKFAEVIENLNSVGDLEFLEPYFKALKKRGIEVNINMSKVSKHESYDGFIEAASEYQRTICNLADELNEDRRETAANSGLVSKKGFPKALQIFNKIAYEKDPSVLINNMYLEGAQDATFAQKATTEVSELVF